MESEERRTAKKKSKAFAVRIVRLYRYLCDEKGEYVLSKQLLRSGTMSMRKAPGSYEQMLLR